MFFNHLWKTKTPRFCSVSKRQKLNIFWNRFLARQEPLKLPNTAVSGRPKTNSENIKFLTPKNATKRICFCIPQTDKVLYYVTYSA